MKIKRLKINGFGKLRNKDIELNDGINIIYGENEAGKSSLLKFISSMLYGTSKNKNSKEISDFDKFLPWKTEDFSGKIEYELDNGESYEVYREFKKKSPVIYNSNKEDISDTFKKDKSKGIDFFFEQTGIDEETFFNTAISEQEGIKLSRTGQNGIIQKISNMVSSGDDTISFKKAYEKIAKKQLDDIGSDRTSQKPINNINRRIDKLMGQKNALEVYKENMYDNTVAIDKLSEELRIDEIKYKFLKEVKSEQDDTRIKSAEITATRNIENELDAQIRELNKQIVDERYKVDPRVYSLKKFDIAIGIFIAFFVLLLIFFEIKIVSLIALLPIIPILIFRNQMKTKKEEMEKTSEKDISNKLEILQHNKDSQKAEADTKEQLLNEEVEKEKTTLLNRYEEELDNCFIENCLNATPEEIKRSLETIENRINTSKFRIQTMQTSANDVSNKLESLARIEEELANAEEEKDELLSLNKSYNIAKECLEKAYDEVKENISPRFIENLCDIVSKVSNGVYNNIAFSDTEGLKVEVDDGKYVSASRLSIGTIDQMYLSLRLSALNEIADETIPIILDESFAFFDDERLKNIFRYLKKNFSEHQIIVLSCSRRELEILEEIDLEYAMIKL